MPRIVHQNLFVTQHKLFSRPRPHSGGFAPNDQERPRYWTRLGLPSLKFPVYPHLKSFRSTPSIKKASEGICDLKLLLVKETRFHTSVLTKMPYFEIKNFLGSAAWGKRNLSHTQPHRSTPWLSWLSVRSSPTNRIPGSGLVRRYVAPPWNVKVQNTLWFATVLQYFAWRADNRYPLPCQISPRLVNRCGCLHIPAV